MFFTNCCDGGFKYGDIFKTWPGKTKTMAGMYMYGWIPLATKQGNHFFVTFKNFKNFYVYHT